MSSKNHSNPTRRSLFGKASAYAVLGVGGGILGARDAFGCHLYVSPIDGRKGCSIEQRDKELAQKFSSCDAHDGAKIAETSQPHSSPQNNSNSTEGQNQAQRSIHAGRPIIVHLNNLALSGPHSPLVDIHSILTKATYLPPGQSTVTHNGRRFFDHSDSGIDAGARNMGRTIALLKNRIVMLDIEEFTSIGLPKNVDYNPQQDRDLAARYDSSSRKSLRDEALRYHVRLLDRIHALSGRENYEFGEYNVPRHLNWYHRENESVKNAISRIERSEILPTLLPKISFCGPQAQLMIDQNMSLSIQRGIITDEMLIRWHAESVRLRREALGSSARILPTIWPRFWGLAGASLPNRSAALKTGFMYRFCNALLDSGADGFICWTPSVDRNLSSSDQQAMARSWREVIQVTRERNFRAVDRLS